MLTAVVAETADADLDQRRNTVAWGFGQSQFLHILHLQILARANLHADEACAEVLTPELLKTGEPGLRCVFLHQHNGD